MYGQYQPGYMDQCPARIRAAWQSFNGTAQGRRALDEIGEWLEGVRADTEEEIYCAARALCKGPRDDWRPYPEFPLRTGGQWGRLEDFAVLARDPAH